MKTVLSDDFKAEALRRILLGTGVAWLLSVPMMLSVVGRLFGLFLLAELMILTVWYVLFLRRIKHSPHPQQRRVVQEGRFSFACTVAWSVYGIVVAGCFIWNLMRQPLVLPDSLYAWFVCIGDFGAPFLLAAVPWIFSSLQAAIRATGESEELNAQNRVGGNIVLTVLLVVSFLASYAMLFYAAPQISKTSPQYAESQQYVTSHDISSLFKEKNAADPMPLAKGLPMSRYLQSISRNDGVLRAEYHFTDETEEIERTVVYNATAFIALLDDIDRVDITVNGTTVSIPRSRVAEMYEDFAHILSDVNWRAFVRIPLKDQEVVNARYSALCAAETSSDGQEK